LTFQHKKTSHRHIISCKIRFFRREASVPSMVPFIISSFTKKVNVYYKLGRGCDRMVVGFATTYTISAYHHWRSEIESRSRWGVLDTTLCDKVCQWLATCRWFSPNTPVSSTHKTDGHDITEILLKVALSTITLTLYYKLDQSRQGFNSCHVVYFTCKSCQYCLQSIRMLSCHQLNC